MEIRLSSARSGRTPTRWLLPGATLLAGVVGLGARCDAGVEGGEAWTLGQDTGPHGPSAAPAPARLGETDPGDPEEQAGAGDEGLDGGMPPERPDAQAVALAQYMQSFVYDQPDPRAARAGYLRAGAYVPVGAEEAVSRRGCADGWYPVEGGFVCNRRGFVVTRSDPTQRYRPTQPNLDASVPYRWAHNSRDGTPMYRQAPTRAMVQAIEGPRDAGPADAGAGGGGGGAAAPPGAPSDAPGAPESPTEPSAGGGGNEVTPTPAAPSEPATPAAPAPAASPQNEPSPATPAPARAERRPAPTAERPAGSTRAADQAPPTAATGPEELTEDGRPTLRTLRGDPMGPLVRRLMRGFMISIDRATRSDGMSFYRSLSGGYVPTSRFYVLTPTVFVGAHLERTMDLPIAFLMTGSVPRMRPDSGGRLERVGVVERKEWVPVVGRRRIGGQEYFELPDGVIVRTQGFRVLEPRTPPPELAEGEKWVDVELSTQSLVAYEGRHPVFATLVSTGRLQGPTGSDLDFTTAVGSFRVESKHITASMQGDTAAEGPYSIEDVPWAMFFHMSYALHGAFWHSRFGRTKSHGCVNMSVQDARWLFDWIEPALPPGWHGVYSSEQHPGTRVIVHGQTPRG